VVCLFLGSIQLRENRLLDTLQARSRAELLLDDFACFFERHDFGRQHFEALTDRCLRNTEVAGGIGLTVPRVKETGKLVGVDLLGHDV